jgi:esterase/lipase
VTPETSLTLQILLDIDEPTINEWFEIVKKAYPQMEGEFYPRFLGIAMGAIKSALEAGYPIEKWIADTRKNNGVE